jgi:hypothetical protein
MGTLRKVAFVVAVLAAYEVRSQPAVEKDVDFAEIQPILAQRCQGCHQGGAAPADLRINTPAALLQGGISGKVIIPGNAAESLLIKRISEKQGVRMPPTGEPLSDAQIALIRRWINEGAKVPAAARADLFTAQVQPILASACYVCHSGTEPRGQLNLSVRSAALKGGASGQVIHPGDSAHSRLIARVTGAGNEPRMPLNGKPLTDEQIATLRTWIDQGAVWPENITEAPAVKKHWAYVKPVRPALPAIKDSAWVRNPIDRFILAKLEKEGLKPSPEASKQALIRRLSLDLTGLPPAPAEVDAFVADTRPDAYERLVDRLFASPAYGERWATPWLDLAHYGDSEGWTTDRQRVAWPYRDWLINALNHNMSFDKFTIEQLAGDLLPNASNEQKIATGFVRSSMLLTEAGTDAEENNWYAQIDRASTVGTVWLGSTMGCAECHNHKYDPFTQKQFYQMVAFFNNADFFDDPPDDRTGYDGNPFGEPKLSLPTPEQAKNRDALTADLRRMQARLNDSGPEFQKREAEWEKDIVAAEKDWRPLRPTKISAQDGTTLTLQADASILASGKNPDSETYVLEAQGPLPRMTAIRIEALPDASLPGGGPGRDYYGNFTVHEVKVEAGSGSQLSKVVIKDSLSDVPPPPVREDPRFKMKHQWDVVASRAVPNDMKATGINVRPRIQLVLIPEKPIELRAGETLRITLVQTAEVTGVNLGHFRLSMSGGANPRAVLNIPAGLRPVMEIAPDKRTTAQANKLAGQFRVVDTELAPVRQRINELQDGIENLQVPTALVLSDKPDVKHPSAYIRMRGAFVSKGDLVDADVPSFLGSLPSDAPPNRLGLAEWLVSKDNPLTARVVVNRFWETIFGRGIVETTEDFGTQGAPPSHPELLDWLGVQFMESGWDMKAIQRLMVTSSTYRQASEVSPALEEKDPSNVLLARGPRFRVEAEMVRDIALKASGLLSTKMYGPPVKPYQPEGLWGWFPGSRVGTDIWNVSPGEDKYRRGLYIFIRRSVRYPSLTVFDAPTREFCVARRVRSDTPLQALTTLNDPAFFEAAKAMGLRIEKEGGTSVASRAVYGFRLATSRVPGAKELDTLLSAFDKSRRYFESHAQEAEKVAGKADAVLAAWTLFSNGLLNLDETLTKE